MKKLVLLLFIMFAFTMTSRASNDIDSSNFIVTKYVEKYGDVVLEIVQHVEKNQTNQNEYLRRYVCVVTVVDDEGNTHEGIGYGRTMKQACRRAMRDAQRK